MSGARIRRRIRKIAADAAVADAAAATGARRTTLGGAVRSNIWCQNTSSGLAISRLGSVAGFGRTGELLGRSLDALGQQFVVIDEEAERIDTLELLPFHADIPGLVGNAGSPQHLAIAGLSHAYCAGVLAMTNDDETNLAVTMAAAVMRPELPVIARTVSPAIAHRMAAFGSPTIINPFDRFGDHLRLALRAPASYQLLTWLESGPGAQLPRRASPPMHGRWVMCGYGRFGKELTADLRAEGLKVVVIEPAAVAGQDPEILVEDASEPGVLNRVRLDEAVGFVAGTDNDTTNLSLVAAARRINPELFIAARQNNPTNAPLFDSVSIEALLVPTEVIAHEVYAQLATPLLWRFLQDMPAMGDEWASDLIDRLIGYCGGFLESLWKVRLNATEAPALTHWLNSGDAQLGPLLHSPDDRDRRLDIIPLLVRRGSDYQLTPGEDYQLQQDDELLLAGLSVDRRALELTLADDSAREYVLFDRHIPSSWIWRKINKTAREVARTG